MLIKYLFLAFFFPCCNLANGQLVRDIKSFGAKGDGKTSDHDAFERAAAFFNQRGGNGKLTISKGVYLVGRQEKGGDFPWQGRDVVHLSNVQNFSIEGAPGAVLRYSGIMKYGAYDPATGKARQGSGYFVNPAWGASLGHCIFIDKSQNVTVKGIELDGNSDKITLGGNYGDVGYQLPHYGIFIQNSKNITVQNVNLHHFGQDGICVANSKTDTPDNIKLLDSKFNYNARQGFSWIGGNGLLARNCQFNHTGKGKFSSAPGAGLDIEAEYGPNRNGTFENCEFEDATGCCMVADSGDSGYMAFKSCTFWSSTTWSIWVAKPGFTFTDCKIYGPVVHGYDSPNDKDATKYLNCYFEDKPYNGKQPAGEFLVETNNMRRVRFENSTFVANYKKLFWISAPVAWKAEEKYQLIGNTFYMNNDRYPATAYAAVLRGAYIKNNTFKFSKAAKAKAYYINDCCEAFNHDGGGNRTE